MTRSLNDTYTYWVLAGVFNNQMTGTFMSSILQTMLIYCRKGVAFNALATFVDFRNPDLSYSDPLDVLRFWKEMLRGHPALCHDYGLREDELPFEYVICVHREARFAAGA